jgi:hypothetical protein
MQAEQPKEPIPELTDEDRKAAFPQGLHGHATHDRAIHFYSCSITWSGRPARGTPRSGPTRPGSAVTSTACGCAPRGRRTMGGSNRRASTRSGGVRSRPGGTSSCRRAPGLPPGDPQTWAAFGIQGLAPYWFEVEATGYVGAGGRTAATLEVEYELLFTNGSSSSRSSSWSCTARPIPSAASAAGSARSKPASGCATRSGASSRPTLASRGSANSSAPRILHASRARAPARRGWRLACGPGSSATAVRATDRLVSRMDRCHK